MIEAGILSGDYIFVRKQLTAQRGDIVVALIGDEATVKYYYPEKDYVRFQPPPTRRWRRSSYAPQDFPTHDAPWRRRRHLSPSLTFAVSFEKRRALRLHQARFAAPRTARVIVSRPRRPRAPAASRPRRLAPPPPRAPAASRPRNGRAAKCSSPIAPPSIAQTLLDLTGLWERG